MLDLLLTFLKNPFISVFLIEDADFMRSLGKMYVVVGVLVIIFIGLALYLYFIDRRISKLEKYNKNE